MRDIDYIIVHCAATKPSMTGVDKRWIDRVHRAQGWLSCGYHFVIKRDGKVEEGRKIDEPGAHCLGYNENSIGICLAGGLSEDWKRPEVNYTPAQWESLTALVDRLTKDYPQAEVKGHNDFTKAKTCPNFNVPTWRNTGKVIVVGGYRRPLLPTTSPA